MILSSSLAPFYSKLTGDELLGRCAAGGNRWAWKEFLCRFNPIIFNTVLRAARRYTNPDQPLCDDLVLRVYQKLNGGLLSEYPSAFHGASAAFIKLISANVVHDYFKTKGQPRLKPLPGNIPDPPGEYNQALVRQVDEYLRREVSPADRQVFWLHHRYGMNAEAIAAIPALRLDVQAVERIIERVTNLVIAIFAREAQQSA